MMQTQELKLTRRWDKTFPKSDKVRHSKVTFVNRYGVTLAADLYVPKKAKGRLPAIAVSGPFGAVKEQCTGLYAQTLAERGYLTLAFDPSFTGESGGEPRYMASPDINTEDFMAAVALIRVSRAAVFRAMPPQPQMPRMPMRSGSTLSWTERKSTAAMKSSVLMSGEAI